MQNDNPNIHVVSVKNSRLAVFRKKPWLLAVLIVLLAFIAVIMVWFIVSQEDEPTPAEDYATLRQDVRTLRQGQNYDQAESQLNEFIQQQDDAQSKYQATIELATVYETQKKFDKALETYRIAESFSPEPSLAAIQGIGRLSHMNGDTVTALEYYKKALAILRQTNSPDLSDVNFYQKQIEQLEQR